MYVILKNNICTGVNNLPLAEAVLAEDEKQVELVNTLEDPVTLLGKTYVNGQLVATAKTPQEKQREKNLIQTVYLSNTDWQVIRHRDQLDLGIVTSLTDAEYQALLAARQKARAAVIAVDSIKSSNVKSKILR